MFMHNKRLQYTVYVSEPNPRLACMIMEQFGGADGERELSHLEVVGSIVTMLNKGLKAQLAEGQMKEAELYQTVGASGTTAKESILFGGAPALCDSAGVPWTAAYIDSRGEPTVDLRSNIAAEARAKIVYERLINITDDPGIKDALGFLMTREVAHQKSFEKALYAIEHNFPPGKLPGIRKYASMYVNTSQGEGDATGPWNSGAEWDRVDRLEDVMPVDGGDGTATVKLSVKDRKTVAQLAERTMSNPSSDPTTGADLGAGPGAGRTKTGDMGGAANAAEAPAMGEAAARHITKSH